MKFITRLGKKIVFEGSRQAAFECRRLALSPFYPPMQPACIVIGAQKSGTSALYKYLSTHPAVASSRLKEINYFSCNSRYSRGPQFYHSHFPRSSLANQQKITIDVTPDYMVSADLTAKRIHSYNPNIKLIALLRNPVVRAYSAWQMYRKNYQNNPDWFYNWVRMCDKTIRRDFFVPRPATFGEDFENDLAHEIETIENGGVCEMAILQHGLYKQQLDSFYELFDPAQLLVLTSEQFKSDTSQHLKTIEDFIGLSNHQWPQSQLVPHYVGNYEEPIPNSARDILSLYYAQHNVALYSLLEKDLAWN